MKIPNCVNCDEPIKWVYDRFVHADTYKAACWGMDSRAEADTRTPRA